MEDYDKAREHRDFGESPAERIKIVQKRALYTYKDVTQPLGKRLEPGAYISREGGETEYKQNEETLGLAGAIHKRKWGLDK